MATSEQNSALQFAPFSSALEVGFWHRLSQLILDVYGLNDKPRDIFGYYSNHEAEGLPPVMNVDYKAFNEQIEVPRRCFVSHGTLRNANTIEEFKNCDKSALLETEGARIWADITSDRAIADPTLLSRFLMLTYADLKKYHYYYWFAFPAIAVQSAQLAIDRDPVSLDKRFNESQISELIGQYEEKCSANKMSAFLVQESEAGGSVLVGLLSDFEALKKKGGKIIFAFSDPCNLPINPGWPLRNFLCLISYHWREQLNDKSVEILCWRLRFKDGQRQTNHSIVLNVLLPEISVAENQAPLIKTTGWERNDNQKLAPRFLDLSSSMDPTRLAESAVDLNLKLMRWRLLPDLDLDLISSTRCLLLGAGTLGCNVARCLLGWGVRNVTLVDNGSVSYSNPVRQSLFEFTDSLAGGKHKALAAAEALKRIFPGVNAVGINLSIPMPGHAIPESMMEQARADIARLESLIDCHDAVVLLMDTRESRWLPTVIAKHKHKIVISSALGFDTYLVVRHGTRRSQSHASATETRAEGEQAAVAPGDWLKPIPGWDLGCYFCNDVVAPGNSTRDRTLDQQCTVSRPGLSMMTSALTVELLVSIITHPHRGEAAAYVTSKDEDVKSENNCTLGVVPHQIRGFLSTFHQMLPACRAFDRCTACSNTVLDTYEREGFNFLMNVFNRPSSYLEDLTGLTALHSDTTNLDDMCLMSDDDD